MPDDILRLSRELLPLQVAFRRHIHRHPELAFREFETSAYIAAQLRKHKIDARVLKDKTGVIALVNPDRERAVALRCELDALPVVEQTDLPYASAHEGIMHACGHDLHMAVIMGTAILLNRLKKKLPLAVKFFFQPAEEEPPGGAVELIKEGCLENPKVEMIFSLHVDPGVATGRIGLRDGPTMASVMDFDITIKGKGGHAARPHATVDAVAVAAEVVESLQKVISREIDPLNPALITIGVIEGGTVRNVIAEQVILRGTARTLTPQNVKHLPRLIKRTIGGICRARGASFSLDFISGYPVMTNHPSANAILRDSYRELFGKGGIEVTPPTMGGEDFAYYLQEIPGAMFRLGVKNNAIGANKSWHAADFTVDEDAIFYGTSLLAKAVIKYCETSY